MYGLNKGTTYVYVFRFNFLKYESKIVIFLITLLLKNKSLISVRPLHASVIRYENNRSEKVNEKEIISIEFSVYKQQY